MFGLVIIDVLSCLLIVHSCYINYSSYVWLINLFNLYFPYFPGGNKIFLKVNRLCTLHIYLYCISVYIHHSKNILEFAYLLSFFSLFFQRRYKKSHPRPPSP